EGLGGYAFMVSNNGTFVAHANRINVTSQYNPLEDENAGNLAELTGEIIDNDIGTSLTNLDGEDVIVGYRSVEGTNWSVALVVPENIILGSVSKLAQDIYRIV